MMKKRRVVITGVGIICSIGNNRFEVLTAMKKNIIGANKITHFSTEKLLTHIGAELKNFDESLFFNKNEIEQMDRTAKLGIIAAKEAILDSGIDQTLQNVGLAFGTCNGGICSIENYTSIDEIPETDLLKYTFYSQTSNIAKYFGISGPINTINTACSASGNAIAFGSDMIKYGYTDIMLAGGADAMSLSVYAGFNSLKALSEEPCSPYSVKTGLTLGEGSAFVILEDMERAIARNAKIYSEICGYGLSNDGYHATAPDPEGMGIYHAVKMAVESSDIAKDDVKYINTHGTGTAANDVAEVRGLRQFFGDSFEKIPISSSKAYFGHNLGAAAAIEYVTTLLALKEMWLPATMNFTTPREGCDLKNLISNNTKDMKEIPQYFLTNNSAFGGNNCSIISRMTNFNSTKNKIENDLKHRVVVIGAGMLVEGRLDKGANIDYTQFRISEDEFSLKDYNKELYTRRMNKLSQISIAAVDSAIEDAEIDMQNIDNHDIGLCYGTAHGSLKSAEKYLSNVMEKGAEFASSIYFPDMVLNSTAGKIAKALKIKGYSSSISNGGNEGIYSLLSAFHILKEKRQKYCIVAAGDERSYFGSRISHAYGLDNNIIEGSTALVLGLYDDKNIDIKKTYVELLGFGMNSSDNELEAVIQAINNANISKDDVELVMYNSPTGLLNKEEKYCTYKSLNKKVAVIDCNKVVGYGESISSLNQVIFAIAEMKNKQYTKSLIISHSVVGGVAVMVMSLLDK